MPNKYLIVGQGLAGTVLGETLSNKGAEVHFVDQGFKEASSSVAAGMYNPVVFKRVVKGWMADDLLPICIDFYNSLEQKLRQEFTQKYEILKFFPNEEYREMWEAKRIEGNQYISEAESSFDNKHIVNTNGYGRVTICGRVVLTNMLTYYRNMLVEENRIDETEFQFDALNEHLGTYKGETYKKIIFCQGHQGVSNPFFNSLPLQKTKGELLRIKAPSIKSNDLLNRGFFIVPEGDDFYLVGSTYNWEDKTLAPTEQGKKTILDKLTKLYSGEFEVVEHTAGLRPTVVDRRPLIGSHNEHLKLAIFNGLGTKGVIIAPYFARHFTDHLLNDTILNKEVDIKRFN